MNHIRKVHPQRDRRIGALRAPTVGETLCGDMNLAWAPLHVTVDRLPRLPTDQTASVIQSDLPSPVACLLPLVRKAQSWPRQAKAGIS